MSQEPENLVLQLLRGLRSELAEVSAKVGSRADELRSEFKSEMNALRAELRSEMNSLRADVASDLATMQKETREQIVGLRRAVIEYHSTVVGHGVLISELEERVRRVEQTLNLPPLPFTQI